jgi:hypothetical protein
MDGLIVCGDPLSMANLLVLIVDRLFGCFCGNLGNARAGTRAGTSPMHSKGAIYKSKDASQQVIPAVIPLRTGPANRNGYSQLIPLFLRV